MLATILLSATSVAAISASASEAPVAAQERVPQTSQSGSGGSDSGSEIQEIVVTAQFRKESAQTVPIAITAFDTKALATSGVSNTADLQFVAPAFQFNTALGAYSQPRIRGIGATGSGPGYESPVATYVDGVYIAASSTLQFSLNDIEQVAVLNGPQGTLFGRNATGGLVQVTTRKPSYDLTTDAELTYGNLDSIVAKAFVSGGLTDHLAASLSAMYDYQGKGFGRNLFTGRYVNTHRNYALRGKLLWEPTSETSVTLAGDYNRTSGVLPAIRLVSISRIGTRSPGGPFDISETVDPQQTVRQGGGSVTIEHDFGPVRLVSLTAYRAAKLTGFNDTDRTPAPIGLLRPEQDDKQFSQEVRLLSKGSSRLNWVLGGMYFWSKSRLNPYTIIPPTGTLDVFTKEGLNSYAGFVQGDYEIAEGTKLTAGVRYTSDKRDISLAALFTPLGAPAAVPAAPPYTAAKTFKKLTWRLSLDHQFSNDLLGYVSYNRGFKSGFFLPFAFTPTTVRLEQIDAYEVGFKSDLFDRKLRFNAAGFYYDYSNPQTTQINNGLITLYNAESLKSYGVDFDATIKPSKRLTTRVGLSWIHARYNSFPSGALTIPITPQTPPPAPPAPNGGNQIIFGPCPNASGANPCDATGNHVQNTPDWTWNASINYTLPTAIGEFALSGNYYHNQGWYPEPDNRTRIDAYDIFNASVTWTNLSGKLDVRVWGKNLSNKAYPLQAAESDVGDVRVFAPGRTYGVTVGIHY